MSAGRPRLLLAAGLVAAWLLPLSAAPVAAATCALSAPTTIQVGTSFSIMGSGFPVTSSVDVSIQLDGASPDTFSVQSDAAGAFRVDMTTETIDIGTTTVIATAGTVCTAQVVYVVSAEAPAPTPAPTRPPAVVSPAAVPGAASQPPRTDSILVRGDLEPDANIGILVLAIVLVTIGLAGLAGSRRAARP